MCGRSQVAGPALAASGVAVLLAMAAATGWAATKVGSPPATGTKEGHQWAVVSVELPVSNEIFPPGPGAEIADSQCLICHSAGMVLRQPPLTKEEWRSEVQKMRSAYGALLPADQVDALSEYLKRINGR
jgi:mono/diheme cytochrome c family protein